MTKPRLLDLFCCAGGAGMGYHRSGFDVVGVDISPQPRYPFKFIRADALQVLAAVGGQFDVIHASPPCQSYTPLGALHPDKTYPDLVAATRAALLDLDVPWVIENVMAALPWVIENVRRVARPRQVGADHHRIWHSVRP